MKTMDGVKNMGSTGELKAGAVLNYAVILLNNLLGLLYMPYMLRMLGQSEFGLYSLVASVIAYLTVLDLGFTNAVIRYTAKFRAEGKVREQQEMFGMFILIYSAISLVALVAGGFLYANVDAVFSAKMTASELARMKPMLLMLLFNLVITFPLSVFGSIITAYEKFVFQKLLVIGRLLLSTAVMIVLLHFGYKAMALVVVQTVFNIAQLIANWIFCRRRLNVKVVFGRFRFGFFKEVAAYSFWILLNVLMDRVYWSTGQFVLGAVAGTAAVAVFSVAVRLEQMYMSFSTAISSVFLPKVTSMVARGEGDKAISDLFIRTGRIQYCVLAFVLTGFIVFGRQFIALWAGPDYDEVAVYTVSLIFFIPLTVPLVQNLGITILQAKGMMRFRSLMYVGVAAVSLVLQILLSKRYGVEGCAWAVAAGLVLGQIIIMNIYYYKVQRIDILRFWKEIFRMSVVPACVCAVSYFIFRDIRLDSVWRLALGILAYCAVYLPLFWLAGVDASEKGLVRGFFMKILKTGK